MSHKQKRKVGSRSRKKVFTVKLSDRDFAKVKSLGSRTSIVCWEEDGNVVAIAPVGLDPKFFLKVDGSNGVLIDPENS